MNEHSDFFDLTTNPNRVPPTPEKLWVIETYIKDYKLFAHSIETDDTWFYFMDEEMNVLAKFKTEHVFCVYLPDKLSEKNLP